ncbi:peptidase S8/S53 domain-containing protein [Syncephalis fuscata]|nr:peptidase S8/S53 domain-containing protein [Syncephalis fuscata]
MKFLLHQTVFLVLAFHAGVNCAQNSIKAAPKSTTSTDPSVIPNSYIFELDSKTTPEAIRAGQEAFLNLLKRKNIDYSVTGRRKIFQNFIGLDVDEESLKIIRSMNVVKNVTPVYKIESAINLPFMKKQEPLSNPYLATDAHKLHEKGLNGAGIRVAVIDSGIDFTHPSLGGGFGPGYKVSYGRDYIKDNYSAKTAAKLPNLPMDCTSHGTHVAGIIAAKGKEFTGIAPNAELGAYRVFNCKNEGNTVYTMEAMEDAFSDGSDIISLSLSLSSMKYDALATTAVSLIAHGAIIVAAAGNYAAQGMWHVVSPSIAPNVIAVGAAYTPADESNWFTLTKLPDFRITYKTACNILPRELGFTEIVATDPQTPCTLPEAAKLRNKILFFDNHNCDLPQMASNARMAGVAAIMVLKTPSTPSVSQRIIKCLSSMTGCCPQEPASPRNQAALPIIVLSEEYEPFMTKTMHTYKTVTIGFSPVKRTFIHRKDMKISSFSSWGPGPFLELKPDIVAPGQAIFSTMPTDKNSFGIKRGTSMATPYVTGAIALYMQAKKTKKISVDELNTALQNSAYPVYNIDKPGFAPVAKQGAGLINVERFVYGETRVFPSSLPLEDNLMAVDRVNGVQTKVLKITNQDNKPQDYVISHESLPSVRGIVNRFLGRKVLREPLEQNVYASVLFDSNRFRLEPGKSKLIKVSIGEPGDELPEKEDWVYSGYIIIDPVLKSNHIPRSKAVFVPYLGLKGSIMRIDAVIQGVR